VIAEHGQIREVRVTPAPETRLPATETPQKSEAL
jgi:hypothetical protein